MQDGFIKTAVGTPKIRLADCEYNAHQIIKLMLEASDKKGECLALPELCITGYTCGDLFAQRRLLNGALEALQVIVKESRV